MAKMNPFKVVHAKVGVPPAFRRKHLVKLQYPVELIDQTGRKTIRELVFDPALRIPKLDEIDSDFDRIILSISALTGYSPDVVALLDSFDLDAIAAGVLTEIANSVELYLASVSASAVKKTLSPQKTKRTR